MTWDREAILESNTVVVLVHTKNNSTSLLLHFLLLQRIQSRTILILVFQKWWCCSSLCFYKLSLYRINILRCSVSPHLYKTDHQTSTTITFLQYQIPMPSFPFSNQMDATLPAFNTLKPVHRLVNRMLGVKFFHFIRTRLEPYLLLLYI